MKVLVTGANGHLGFNLVTALLKAGRTVRGSVRSLSDPGRTGRLEALKSVELVEADLKRPDQLRAAMDGVDLVYHVAAVYSYTEPHRKNEILDASIKGAESAVRAAADARVRKVVLTSSVVTLPMTRPGEPPVDETEWADDLRVPYIRAKTEGERAAWRTARELGVNLVSVLPGAITGPGFQRNTPSIDLIESMMRGALRLGVPRLNFPLVDVRDVAAAHRLVGEQDCEGRFIVCNDTMPTFKAMLETMHAIDPRVPLPYMTLPDFALGTIPFLEKLNRRSGAPATASPEMISMVKGKIWNASNRRIKETLGWTPTVTMEQTLQDTMDVLRARGV